MSTALYAQLKAKVDELHDPDEDVTAHAAAMRVLNALWPTVEALARDRDRLRLIIADASAAAGSVS